GVDQFHYVPALQQVGQPLGARDGQVQTKGDSHDALQEHHAVVKDLGGTAAPTKMELKLGRVGNVNYRVPVPVLAIICIGLLDPGETFRLGTEVEGAPVHHHTGDGGAVPAQVLGGRVHHEVGPVLDGAEQVGGGHGVVDHQGSSDTVCGVGDGAHVQDVAAGVG